MPALYTPKNTTSYTIPATGKVVYVSMTGAATNTGLTASSPVQFDKALTLITNTTVRNTLVFLDGSYDRTMIVTKPNLTLMANPGANPVLEGSDIMSGWVQEGNYWTKSFPYKFVPQQNDPRWVDTDYTCAGNSYQMWIDDVFMPQVELLGQLVPGKFYAVDATNTTPGKLYIANNPAGRVLRASTRSHGLQIKGNQANGTRVRGLNAIRFALSGAICEYAASLDIQDCVFNYNNYYGVKANTSNSLFKNNQMSYNGAINLGQMFDSSNTTFEDNLFSHGNYRKFNTAWAAAAVKIAESTDLKFLDNTFADTPCSAFWMDIRCNNILIKGNKFLRSNHGIHHEICFKAWILNNLFDDCNIGVYDVASDGCEIKHNTFIRCMEDIWVKDDKRVNALTGQQFVSRNVEIVNNYHQDTGRLALRHTPYLTQIVTDSISVLKNNQYIRVNNQAQVFVAPNTSQLFSTLAQFKTRYPQYEVGSVESATTPATKLRSIPLTGMALTHMGGVTPSSVGYAGQVNEPEPPPPYTPPTEAEYLALMRRIRELEGTITVLHNDKMILGFEIDELTSELAAMTTLRDQAVVARNQAITARDQAVANLTAMTTLRDQAVTNLTAMTTLRDQAVTNLTAMTTLRDQAVANLTAMTALRDAAIVDRNTAITARDAAIADLAPLTAERDQAIAARETAITARDAAIADRNTAITERDTAVQNLVNMTTERNQAVSDRTAAIAARDEALDSLAPLTAQLDQATIDRDAAIADRDEAILDITTVEAARDTALANLAIAQASLAELTAERAEMKEALQYYLA